MEGSQDEAQGKNLEADSKPDTTEKCCLLACSSCIMDTIMDWTLPQQAALKKTATELPIGQRDRHIFSVEAPTF